MRFEKTESEIVRIYDQINDLNLNDLYETLRLETEEAIQQGEINSLPTVPYNNKELTMINILSLIKYGIKIKIDIRYILAGAYKENLNVGKIQIPPYGTYEFTEFMDEIEERRILLRRALKRIFQPEGTDTEEMKWGKKKMKNLETDLKKILTECPYCEEIKSKEKTLPVYMQNYLKKNYHVPKKVCTQCYIKEHLYGNKKWPTRKYQ